MNNTDNHLFSIDDNIFAPDILNKIKQNLNCEQVFVYKLDSQQKLDKIIYPSISQQKKTNIDHRYIVENSEGILKTIINDSQSKDNNKDDEDDDTLPIQTAQIVIPIELKTPEVITINNNINLWGILFIYDYNCRRIWSEEEKIFIDEMVLKMILAIEKNILYTKFKQLEKSLSIYQFFDQETGLINYSSFLDCLEYEWHNLARDKNLLSLILIHIETKDKLNLTVWKHIAGIIQQQIKRPADIVARYDGDKIVAMLPKTDNNGALYVDGQIRASIIPDYQPKNDYQFRSSIVTYQPNSNQNYEFLLAKIEKPFVEQLDFSENIYNQNLV